jgi:hypothetical protein
MIAILKQGNTVYHATDLPTDEYITEDGTCALPEVLRWDGILEGYFVLRGCHYNDHANRHELVYELAEFREIT